MGRAIAAYLKGVSKRTEFVLVLAVAFGPPVFASLHAVAHYPIPRHQTNAGLLILQLHELVILGLLGGFLRLRGWSLKEVGLTPSLKGTGIGLLIFVTVYVTYVCAVWLLSVPFPSLPEEARSIQSVTHGVWISNVIGVSLINPLFEELFVSGYIITSLKNKDSYWLAINVSVATRLMYHLYQGPLGVISIVPLGLIFSLWYVRTGRLWPLLVAHALGDFIPLAQMVS